MVSYIKEARVWERQAAIDIHAPVTVSYSAHLYLEGIAVLASALLQLPLHMPWITDFGGAFLLYTPRLSLWPDICRQRAVSPPDAH